MDETGQVCLIRQCKHVFHQECLDKWLQQKNECPLCKVKVDCVKDRPQAQAENNAAIAMHRLFFQMNELNQPMEEYFREFRGLQQDLEAFGAQARRGRVRHVQADREFALALLMMTVQLRNVQRTLTNNRRQIGAVNGEQQRRRPFH